MSAVLGCAGPCLPALSTHRFPYVVTAALPGGYSVCSSQLPCMAAAVVQNSCRTHGGCAVKSLVCYIVEDLAFFVCMMLLWSRCQWANRYGVVYRAPAQQSHICNQVSGAMVPYSFCCACSILHGCSIERTLHRMTTREIVSGMPVQSTSPATCAVLPPLASLQNS